MRERHRTILKLELLQIAPLGVALMLAFALLTLQIHVWLAWIIVGVGVVASTRVAVVAARGSGPFSKAPLLVKARAGLWLQFVRSAVVIAVISLLGLFLPNSLTFVLLAVLWVGFVVVNVRPYFGYGRLGRELTEAAREEERASWRN